MKDIYRDLLESYYSKPICPKRVELEEFNKKYQKSSLHFIQRVKERYNIEISIKEYNLLLNNKINRKFKGVYSKNSNNTLGVLKFKGIDVWVLYNSRLKLFLTAYPPIIAEDTNEMITACFSRPVRYIARELYKIILNELNLERIDFNSDKDAAIHYFNNCRFSTLLIDKYKKGNIHPIKFCNEISKILYGEHPKVSINII